jgi:hypothetical protein
MANLCTCDISIQGESSQLSNLYNRLKGRDKSIVGDYPFLKEYDEYYGLVTCQYYQQTKGPKYKYHPKGSINLTVLTKRIPPLEGLKKLSMEYPELLIHIDYQEPATESFGSVYYSKGEGEETVIDPHDYYCKGIEFQRAVKELKEMDYDTLINILTKYRSLEKALGETAYEINGWYYLERYVIERIKHEDLPLFINFKWQIHGEELWKKRLNEKL